MIKIFFLVYIYIYIPFSWLKVWPYHPFLPSAFPYLTKSCRGLKALNPLLTCISRDHFVEVSRGHLAEKAGLPSLTATKCASPSLFRGSDLREIEPVRLRQVLFLRRPTRRGWGKNPRETFAAAIWLLRPRKARRRRPSDRCYPGCSRLLRGPAGRRIGSGWWL